jgi:hypothetical protein
MSVEFSKVEVIRKNKIAIDVCNQSINILRNTDGLTISQEDAILIQLSRAINERTSLRQVNAHLKAAGTIVNPMDDEVANELNKLGNSLDQKIQNDLIINATIAFITDTLSDIGKLRNIVSAHQG